MARLIYLLLSYVWGLCALVCLAGIFVAMVRGHLEAGLTFAFALGVCASMSNMTTTARASK